MEKLPLRQMGYPLGSLTMDPSKGGLALQEASTQHSLQQLSYDPCFAERAAKYSTFGSANYASLRGSSQIPGSYSSFETNKLRDVLESESITKPSIVIPATSFSGSQLSEDENKPKARSASPGVEAIEGAKATASDGVTTSQENSSGSQPVAPPPPPTTTVRKRKGSAASSSAVEEGGGGTGKGVKEPTTSSAGGEINSTEHNTDAKTSEQTPLKRQRSDAKTKAERSASENSGDSSPRSLKGATSKPPKDDLPKQDYIHVRARRGQATDSHSLAERVRREKISERMKFLQDLVPGCSKVTGKAVMLDEIINYVQSLQRQIEFLSMKLAAVNPRMEYSYDLLGKDLAPSRSPETTLLGPDPLPGFGDLHNHGPVHHHHPPMHLPPPAASHHLDNIHRVDTGLCDAYLRRSMSVPSMPSLASIADDHFDPLSQVGSLCNGDLQSVVEMGFFQGRQGLGFGSHHGKLKVEM